tara:strand:+ start:193 stop:939 length:747 start_codon:yes stop_codon:yes gene_type:complete
MLKLGKHKIEFYDSIDLMPFDRFNSFNKFIMLDAELGSDVIAFDQKISKIFEFLGKEMTKNATNELYNLRVVYHNIMEMNNNKGLAFACLIRSIDGEPLKNYSIENLRAVLEKLNSWGLKMLDVSEHSDNVKKKIEQELKLFFPKKFNNLSSKDISSNRKKLLISLCDEIIEDTKIQSVDKIQRYLLNLAKPKTFNGSGSYEIEFDKAFEELCHSLSTFASGRNIKKMTVKEVYVLIEFNQKQQKNGG